ncbi:MAG: hypothetical protein J6X55_03770 [Victivallales bacterium]|nr:hypothetical protein [Victivallales bacterium]
MLEALVSFDAKKRMAALAELAKNTSFPPENTQVNMHLHTFFSYNGEGWSPARIAYEMKKLGVYSAAICDFDVLQGLDEFLAATDLLKLRAAVAFESRTFFREYADKEINSPGEPGVYYFMGMGFVKQPATGSKAAAVFKDMLERSHARNRAVIARINAKLTDFQLDYDTDVLPLTPEKNATERHICVAFYNKAIQILGSKPKAAASWAKVLGISEEDALAKIDNQNAFTDLLRSKLIKKGGVGYAQPDDKTFPLLDDVIAMILDCRAIPMTAWLDGSLPGENNPVEQLELLKAKGVPAVNIIPDRNWNFKDEAKKAIKVAELNKYVAAATKLDMPINVGTEANKPGQRLLDDFASDALAPHHPIFLKGAQIMVGHTRLLRFANLSYVDKAADDRFGTAAAKNDFFASVGALPAPSSDILAKISAFDENKAFAYLADSAKKGTWC